MSKRRKRPRVEPYKVPRLSRVEWAGVQIYLAHMIAVEERELTTWREVAKISRNPQSIGAVAYHRDALTAFQRAARWVDDHCRKLSEAGSFEPATTDLIDVIARN